MRQQVITTNSSQYVPYANEIEKQQLFHADGGMLKFVLNNTDNPKHTSICFVNDRIVGWCNVFELIDKDGISIDGMIGIYVDPEFRNQGIGQSLVQYLEPIISNMKLYRSQHFKFRTTNPNIKLFKGRETGPKFAHNLLKELKVSGD